MSYETIKSQPNRLGEFSGDVDAAISAVGVAAVGITRAITESETLQTQARYGSKTAISIARSNTNKLRISTKGATEQARIDVQRVKATYGSITNLIIGGGAVFATLILAGAFAYSIAKGDEDEYEYV